MPPGRAAHGDPMMMLQGQQVGGAADQQPPGGGGMAGAQLQQFAGHPHLMIPGVGQQVLPPAVHRHVRRDAARRVMGEEVRVQAIAQNIKSLQLNTYICVTWLRSMVWRYVGVSFSYFFVYSWYNGSLW